MANNIKPYNISLLKELNTHYHWARKPLDLIQYFKWGIVESKAKRVFIDCTDVMTSTKHVNKVHKPSLVAVLKQLVSLCLQDLKLDVILIAGVKKNTRVFRVTEVEDLKQIEYFKIQKGD